MRNIWFLAPTSTFGSMACHTGDESSHKHLRLHIHMDFWAIRKRSEDLMSMLIEYSEL